MRALHLLPILALSLSGCGYKGPLYLPQDKPAAETKQSQPAAADTNTKADRQQETR
ncbi:MAG: lipoprotein [Pseudomonadota bacterium]|jgi:predicted small lipoprotein YifL